LEEEEEEVVVVVAKGQRTWAWQLGRSGNTPTDKGHGILSASNPFSTTTIKATFPSPTDKGGDRE